VLLFKKIKFQNVNYVGFDCFYSNSKIKKE